MKTEKLETSQTELDCCGESLQSQMHAALKKAQARQYINMFKWASVAQDYIDGNVAMILDVVPGSKVEVEGTITTDAV